MVLAHAPSIGAGKEAGLVWLPPLPWRFVKIVPVLGAATQRNGPSRQEPSKEQPLK